VLAFFEENGSRVAHAEWHHAYLADPVAAAFLIARAKQVADAANILKEAQPDLYSPGPDIYLYEDPGRVFGMYYAVVPSRGGGLDVVILCCGDVNRQKTVLDKEASRRRTLV
jgi:hypothetical protein